MTSHSSELVIAPLPGPTFSIVAPVYNEEETVPHFYERIVAVMEEVGEPFELVLVDDGSRDGSYRTMREIQRGDPRVRVIEFSRNFGHQIAISAGLDYARGQCVVIIDSDLQDPPEVIPDMIERWRAGAEVVYAQRSKRAGETRFKLITASLFYRLIGRLTAVEIPRDTGDFRLAGPQRGGYAGCHAGASPFHAWPFRLGWISPGGCAVRPPRAIRRHHEIPAQ